MQMCNSKPAESHYLPAVLLRVSKNCDPGSLGAATLVIKGTLTTDSNGFPRSHVHMEEKRKNSALEHCVSLFTLNYAPRYQV